MPLYEYRCEECTKSCELLLKNANEEVACPHCGSKRLAKLLSSFATTQSPNSPCGIESSCPAAPCCGGKCKH